MVDFNRVAAYKDWLLEGAQFAAKDTHKRFIDASVMFEPGDERSVTFLFFCTNCHDQIAVSTNATFGVEGIKPGVFEWSSDHDCAI